MAELSEQIHRSTEICHYRRFSGFSRANCNACHAADPKISELLHLFAENGLINPLVCGVSMTFSRIRCASSRTGTACLSLVRQSSPNVTASNLLLIAAVARSALRAQL